jgi:hypothetical protein
MPPRRCGRKGAPAALLILRHTSAARKTAHECCHRPNSGKRKPPRPENFRSAAVRPESSIFELSEEIHDVQSGKSILLAETGQRIIYRGNPTEVLLLGYCCSDDSFGRRSCIQRIGYRLRRLRRASDSPRQKQ